MKHGDSAFPSNPYDDGFPHWGLTKREYLASHALQGVLAAGIILDAEDIVRHAIIYADLLGELLEEDAEVSL